jgi:phospholipase C
MRPSIHAVAAFALLASSLSACAGGSRPATPVTPGAGSLSHGAPLTLGVRLPATASGTLAVTAFADGSRQPATPTATASLGTCAIEAGERLCTLQFAVPAGSIDIAVRAGSLSGTAVRQSVPAAGASLRLAFDGTPAAWALTPALIAGPADGAAHEIPFAIEALDAQGYTLLGRLPGKNVAVTIANDPTHAVSVRSEESGEFVAAYDGRALGDVKVNATVAGAGTANAPFASLAVSPQTLEVPAGSSVKLSASLAHYAGAFSATPSERNCSVAPARATPSAAGGPVAFTVRIAGSATCTITVAPEGVVVQPIAVAAKKVPASVGVGIGPSKIQHIIVLLQENRSFDNIFGGKDGKGKPFPGADTVSNPLPGEPTPHDHNGNPVKMVVGKLNECYDPYHDSGNGEEDVDGGKMDGFDLEGIVQESCAPGTPPPDYPYRTMMVSEVMPYWQMGEQYAIGDRMFEPSYSASYGAHLYYVAAQSANTIDNPSAGEWGCDGASNSTVNVIVPGTNGEVPGPFPCFIVGTLADSLDRRGVSWRFYSAVKPDFGVNWLSYDSFSAIRYGPDWTTNVTGPPSKIVSDINSGNLAAMNWVTPTNNTSDHPQAHEKLGPAWITSVVNAVGQSKYWDSTAIFITWDDWGGWYDHVPPPSYNPTSLGVRVPLIVVSPYARNGYVSHVTHTTGSILHFAEEVFDLDSLGQDDAVEDDMADIFNFAQAPTPFTKFKAAQTESEALRAATIPDRGEHVDAAGD